MDEDDSKGGSKEEEEEEAVDPLEEHEKRLQLAREQKEKEKGGEPDKTEEKTWFSTNQCTMIFILMFYNCLNEYCMPIRWE